MEQSLKDAGRGGDHRKRASDLTHLRICMGPRSINTDIIT